jgi:methanogenic corrinoid protein MtbC1
MRDLNAEVRDAILQRLTPLAEAIVAKQYSLQPEIWQAYGYVGREKSVPDAACHLRYLGEAIAASDPSLFCDYIAWAKVLFSNLNLPEDVLPTTLRCTADVLSETLSPQHTPLALDYLSAASQALVEAPSDLPSFIGVGAPLVQLASDYLHALLEGERRAASDLVLDALNGGVPVREIYLHVFRRTQHEIGRLWQLNRVTVAQEHYCTAATQLIMSQLYPRIFATDRIGRRLVAACVAGEMHEIGIRMVADFMEMEGWDTYYLGANTPTGSIKQSVMERCADVLAISATLTSNLGAVAEVIGQIRASNGGVGIKIMVGGYPFNHSRDLWLRMGADGCAVDAQEAVETARKLAAGD